MGNHGDRYVDICVCPLHWSMCCKRTRVHPELHHLLFRCGLRWITDHRAEDSFSGPLRYQSRYRFPLPDAFPQSLFPMRHLAKAWL
jgi:hypothetical protein